MGVTCPVCQVKFCRTNNFNRHFKEQHYEKLNEENQTYQCLDCEAQFKRKEHIRNHINSVHKIGVELKCSSCSFTTVNKHSLVRHIGHIHHNQHPAKEEIKIEKSLKRDILYFFCSYCSRKFRQKHALMIHLRAKHNCNTPPSFNVKKVCPLCSFETVSPVSKGLDVMYDHFLSKHGLTMNIETFDFKNMSEFEIWKTDLENETASKFIRSNRHAKTHVRFTCHRSGNFQSKGSGKRNLKKKGSCKINGFCPASIVADLFNEGNVQVNYLSTHVGHTNDLKHILLSSDERKEIANKIVQNVPCEQILGEIRGNITTCDIKRIHLTTRKDILNIKKSMLIETLKKDSEVVDESWAGEDGSEVNNTEVVPSSTRNGLNVGGLLDTINRHFSADDPTMMWSNEVSSSANKPNDEVMVCSPDNSDPIVICLEIPSENLVQTPNFESNKEDFVTKLTDMLRDKITNFEELQAIQEHCKPISLILDSMKAMENPSMVRMPVPQPQQITFTVTDGKGYVSTIRTNTTGSSHIVDVDSVTSNEKDNMFAIQLV